jgi:thymidylate synthase (FAD)
VFKTIEKCRLDLVSYTRGTEYHKDLTSERTEEMDMDFMPASAARVSFGREDKTGNDVKADIKLMNYLAREKHMSPFEHQSATFLVEVPLFIRSQIHRHRTFAYNEISRRYTDDKLEFWIPTTVRKQSESNRQASSNEEVDPVVRIPNRDTLTQGVWQYKDIGVVDYFAKQAQDSLIAYEDLREHGVSREQARGILPQTLLTKFYMTGNLRNWAHFLELRLGHGAQGEIQVVAQRIKDELMDLWPNAMGALINEKSN